MADIDPNELTSIIAEAVNQGYKPILTVESNSMAPLIRKGDQLQIIRTRVEELAPGEVVILETTEGLLVHRYWRTNITPQEQDIVTKGDRLVNFDRPSKPEQLIGSIATRNRGTRKRRFDTPYFRFTNKLLFDLCRIENWLLNRISQNSSWQNPEAGDSFRGHKWGSGWIRQFFYFLAWCLNLLLQ